MGDAMRRVGRVGVIGAALMALGAGAAGAVPYNILIERVTSPFSPPGAPEEEELTFSGAGTVDIVSGAIADLALSVQTLGEVNDSDAVFTFIFDETDVVRTVGLDAPLAPDLSGVVIGLVEKTSQGGEAEFLGFGSDMEGLTLDFTSGVAAAFCVGFTGDDLNQCVRGGGSSSGLEANLSAAVIPLPASLPLALTGLGGLALWRRARRAA
jgi:hypothetical protein